jgi:chromosome partitioning protein
MERRVLTVASHKGGVGKTTTTLNLAYSLGRIGARVLAFDLDPQGGLAASTLLRRRTERGLVDVMKRRATPVEVRVTSRDGLLTVVGLGGLESDEIGHFERSAAGGPLRMAIDSLSDGFDIVLLDAPAGIGSVVRALLQASDGVLLVVNCRAVTLRSLPTFLELVESVGRDPAARLVLEGVLVSMFDADDPGEARALAELEELLPEGLLLRTRLPRSPAYEDASRRGLPLSLVPTPEAQAEARRFLDLALELRERQAVAPWTQSPDDEPGLF